MVSPQRKPLLVGTLCLLLVWLVAGTAYWWSHHAQVTAETVRTYLRSIDLHALTGPARARALARLAALINALPAAERRTARFDREWTHWFTEMTEPEKGDFIEATVPTGFHQMLGAFEELPADRRKRAIDQALKRMKEDRDRLALAEADPANPVDTNGPPALSEELRQKVVTLGLQSFYSQSSAQTKAELAPVLEELQGMLQNGAFLHNRYGPAD